jgi:hypothetical protein
MQHLLDLGVDINGFNNELDQQGVPTPPYCAARAMMLERARFLLEKGADPHRLNRFGHLPVQMIFRRSMHFGLCRTVS